MRGGLHGAVVIDAVENFAVAGSDTYFEGLEVLAESGLPPLQEVRRLVSWMADTEVGLDLNVSDDVLKRIEHSKAEAG